MIIESVKQYNCNLMKREKEMANMSYCMFENTADGLAECLEKLEEYDFDLESLIDNASSNQEKEGIKRLVNFCIDVSEAVDPQ